MSNLDTRYSKYRDHVFITAASRETPCGFRAHYFVVVNAYKENSPPLLEKLLAGVFKTREEAHAAAETAALSSINEHIDAHIQLKRPRPPTLP